jgi:Tol biopolymer transport system component
MPLQPGSKLGSYEILSAVDTSDGGERYKASDTESKREVAIQVCARPVSERCQQEAMAVAALHHPNICAVHDIGHQDGVDFLVLEAVEGQTLAERLEGGRALPLDKAISIGIEIADALDKAHLAGVTHRCLQPSKVVLGASGAKLLDFGLADAKSAPPEAVAATAAAGVTSPKGLAAPVADAGLAYTAPEILEGKEGDWRSDIFAFGAMLYEMAAGKKAFDGRSRAVMIAAIATTSPEPIAKSQPRAPALLQHIVDRCLAKDPDERWQTAHDLLVQLRWIGAGGKLAAEEGSTHGMGRLTKVLLAAAATLTAVLAVPAALYWRGTPEPAAFQFRVPVRGLSTADIALSPDGNMIAMVARPNTALPAALYVRRTGGLAFQRLGGTEDAAQPFWSADSLSIGFIVGGRLKRVSAAGGAPKDIADAQGFSGGAWNRDGTILFGSSKGLFRVSAEGGKPVAVTTLDGQETGHYWPSFLPDGKGFVYLAWSGQVGARAVFAGKLESKEKTRLMNSESNALYAAPGYLVFHRESSLFAQAIDTGKPAMRGEPIHVADDVSSSSGNGRGNFDVSQNGSLIYYQGANAPAGRGGIMFSAVQWGWVDRSGRPIEPAGEPGPYGDFDLSPDGKLIAVTKQDSGPGADIWVIDWQRAGVSTRLTLDPADDINPVWSPDGKRIAFTSYRKGNADIYVAEHGSGTGKDTPLVETGADEMVKDWSKDGKYLAYLSSQDNFYDIWALPLVDGKPAADKKPFPVVQGRYQKGEPQFSHDGKWLAYTSDRTVPGTFQVYVRSFPEGDQEIAVSTTGGGQPRWRKDGKELYYRFEDNILAVDIQAGTKLVAGIPRSLFFAPLRNNPGPQTPTRHLLAAAPDGQRFLLRYPSGLSARGSGAGNLSVPEVPIISSAANPATAAGGRGGAPVSAATVGAPSNGLTVIQHWPSGIGKGNK